MERTAIQTLNKWKGSTNRKPLVLNGARQVGKTWLLRHFGESSFNKVAYVVCRKNEEVFRLFQLDFDVRRILRGLSAISNVDITPGDTLVILDEVQEVPEALEALKYFCEQMPEYCIAVAGSLLGLSLHNNISYPVGKVDEINLYPLDFREFLLACAEYELYEAVCAQEIQVLALMHNKLVDLLRQYYYVGGMPEVVAEYISTGALQKVRAIQYAILRGYERDFSKHAPAREVPRIRMVWNSIPSQLFRENKKFFYGALRTGARSREFEMALEWLLDAGLLYRVPRCSQLALPLPVYEEFNAFKLYLLDVGLLGAMANTEASQVLLKNDVFKEYKGGMTEQYVLQQLISRGAGPIFYHTTDDSRLEIDFLIQRNGNLLPIEVKAEGNVRANSLIRVLEENPQMRAERYSMLPYKEQGSLTNVPLYML